MAPPQTDLSAPKAYLTELHSSGSTESKPPSDPSTAVRPPGSRDLLKTEQVMLPHLPIVGIMARRIHERLPQHVPIDSFDAFTGAPSQGEKTAERFVLRLPASADGP
jgi:hypothetical protein